MEKYWAITPLTYLKKIIDINYQDELAGDVACLDNEKCVVKFKTACLIIDLNPNSSKKVEIFDFKTHQIYFCKIIPNSGGEFTLFDGQNMHRVNSQHQVITFKSFNSFVYFCGSGNIWNLSEKRWHCLSKQKYVNQIEYPSKHIFRGVGDTEELIISLVQEHQISFYNVRTAETTTVAIPMKINISDNKIKANIFIIDKKQAIYGYLKGYQKGQSHIFILALIHIEKNTMQNIHEFEGRGQFISINKKQSMVSFILAVNRVKSLMVVYNYKQRVIIWQHQISPFKYELPMLNLYIDQYYEAAKRFSPDLKNYVELERINYETKLVHYRQVSAKKIYFHLLEKSGCFDYFGVSVAREIFKVMMI